MAHLRLGTNVELVAMNLPVKHLQIETSDQLFSPLGNIHNLLLRSTVNVWGGYVEVSAHYLEVKERPVEH